MIQSPKHGLRSLLIALNLSPTTKGANELLQPLINYASELDDIPGIDSPAVTGIVNRLVIEYFIKNFVENLLNTNLNYSIDILSKLFVEKINQQSRFAKHF